MRASQALRRDEPACVQADLAHYWREGYAIVRGLFDAKETSFTRRARRTAAASGTEICSTT